MKNPITKHPKRAIAYSALFLLHVLIFTLTDPLNSQVLVIIGGFLLISVDIAIVASLLVGGLAKIAPPLRAHSRRVAILLSSFSIVLLALSSIGQLTWHDVLAVVAIGVLAYFYSIYFRVGVRRHES